MTEEFARDDDKSVSASVEGSNDQPAALPEQELLCVTVTGSPTTVRETIHTLYRLGFASVGDWSQPQRSAKPGLVVSVLIRRRQGQAAIAPAVKPIE